MKNTLILLEHWKRHFLKKNIGINILSTNENFFIYCNKTFDLTSGINFINSRVTKLERGIYPSFKRGFKIFYILFKYRINKINWAYITDDELFFICLYKLIFNKNLFIGVKTDSENITSNRFFYIKKIIFKHIDRLYVETNHIKDVYSLQLPGVSIKILYNPSFFELEKFSPKKDSFSFTNLLFVGRISREKNIGDFLNISYELFLKDNSIKVKLLLLEDDKEYWESEILPLISNFNKFFHIEYIINASVTEMYNYYSNSDILCITSSVEGVPNVISDAYYMGLPVISYKVGNIPYLLNNDLVIACDLEDFVVKVLNLENKETFSHIKHLQHQFYLANMSLDVFKKLI